MAIIGKLTGLKSSIEQQFETDISALKEEADQEISTFKAEEKSIISSLEKDSKSEQEFEVEKAHRSVYNEGALKLDRAFEQKRQELIEQVFDDALSRASKFALTKEYLAFAKKHFKTLPKNVEIRGHSPSYKKIFKKLKLDKTIIGLKAVSTEVTYDLTVSTLIEAKQDALKQAITKALFGEIN